MKTYTVMYCKQNKVNWEMVPVLSIDCYQVKPVIPVEAKAQVCWTEDALLVRLCAKEPQILARFSGDQDPVCRDSCLEIFLCPIAGDGRYFNFECNPNAATYFGFGFGREDRMRLHPGDIRELLSINMFQSGDQWGVTFRLPIKVIRLFMPEFILQAGIKMRANFYKCGDDILPNHELMWSPITNGRTDFHQSEFFGELQLSDDTVGTDAAS